MSVFVLTAMDFAVLGFLVPSLWEIEVAFAASIFVILVGFSLSEPVITTPIDRFLIILPLFIPPTIR
jgi:hypothetical protein